MSPLFIEIVHLVTKYILWYDGTMAPTSVADPDPYVFCCCYCCSPGSRRYELRILNLRHQAKMVNKPQFLLFCDFLSFRQSEVRIRGYGSVTKCHGSATKAPTLLDDGEKYTHTPPPANYVPRVPLPGSSIEGYGVL